MSYPSYEGFATHMRQSRVDRTTAELDARMDIEFERRNEEVFRETMGLQYVRFASKLDINNNIDCGRTYYLSYRLTNQSTSTVFAVVHLRNSPLSIVKRHLRNPDGGPSPTRWTRLSR